MPLKIITIHFLLDEILKALDFKDDKRAQVSMTVALVAAYFFAGCQQKSLDFLIGHGYIKSLSKSRFNRRLHAIEDDLWQVILNLMARFHQLTNKDKVFLVDTFPVPACHNIRIRRSRLYRQESFRGYCASKKQYCFGLKVCLIVTEQGKPVEILLAPGSCNDLSALRSMEIDLPAGSTLFTDGGFLDGVFEALLLENADIHLVTPRRSNMKEQLPGWLEYLRVHYRQRVETSFSQITDLFARSIHAVTSRGFELKVFLTVLAFSIVY